MYISTPFQRKYGRKYTIKIHIPYSRQRLRLPMSQMDTCFKNASKISILPYLFGSEAEIMGMANPMKDFRRHKG